MLRPTRRRRRRRRPWTCCHTRATERIWIKTRSSAGRGLLLYEALMGVERSLDYLWVKARGQRAVKCQTSDFPGSQVRRRRISLPRRGHETFLFFSTRTDAGNALVPRRLRPKLFLEVNPSIVQTDERRKSRGRKLTFYLLEPL